MARGMRFFLPGSKEPLTGAEQILQAMEIGEMVEYEEPDKPGVRGQLWNG